MRLLALYSKWLFTRLAVSVGIFMILIADAYSQAVIAPRLKLLKSANNIECHLSHGSTTSWSEQEQPTTEIAEFGDSGFFIVSSLDHANKTAYLHWQDFSHPVNLLPTRSGISFIYTPDQGSLFLTTIFADTIGSSARFKMTHSRHIYLKGRALPSQYSGYCVVN